MSNIALGALCGSTIVIALLQCRNTLKINKLSKWAKKESDSMIKLTDLTSDVIETLGDVASKCDEHTKSIANTDNTVSELKSTIQALGHGNQVLWSTAKAMLKLFDSTKMPEVKNDGNNK